MPVQRTSPAPHCPGRTLTISTTTRGPDTPATVRYSAHASESINDEWACMWPKCRKTAAWTPTQGPPTQLLWCIHGVARSAGLEVLNAHCKGCRAACMHSPSTPFKTSMRPSAHTPPTRSPHTTPSPIQKGIGSSPPSIASHAPPTHPGEGPRRSRERPRRCGPSSPARRSACRPRSWLRRSFPEEEWGWPVAAMPGPRR